jgi:hypothetical protein
VHLWGSICQNSSDSFARVLLYDTPKIAAIVPPAITLPVVSKNLRRDSGLLLLLFFIDFIC